MVQRLVADLTPEEMKAHAEAFLRIETTSSEVDDAVENLYRYTFQLRRETLADCNTNFKREMEKLDRAKKAKSHIESLSFSKWKALKNT